MQLSTIVGIAQNSAGISPLLAAIRRLATRRARRRSPEPAQNLAGSVTADFESDVPLRAVSVRIALWQPPS